MNFSFSFMLIALRAAASKIPITIALAFISLVIGVAFGLLIALARFFNVRILAFIFRWLVTVVKGIPVVLLLLVFYVVCASVYDPFMTVLGFPFTFKNLNKAIIAVAALSVYSSIGLSEAFRGSLASVKKGQYDAGFAAGLTSFQVITRIALPQAIPVSLPIVCNIFIALTKAVALSSMVAVVDVMGAAVITVTSNYRFLEAYVAAAIVYWGICLAIESVFAALEKISARAVRDTSL
ncbi:MAG: ABC transporter permease subunit [Treponema sp.]|jgi:L-cystine transport system permease protein|nr:ABC transporter permease subunit [Treponema sp.]